ncbi:MAG TPA: amino acid adenylation domain-containing protein [Pyrinomonadaceae bacterium]|nr:amino acid adenylation domain-containing protein [Pyrinomonadaceae bacterium]
MPQTLVEESSLETKSHFNPEGVGLSGPRIDNFVAQSFPVLFEAQVVRHATKVAVTCGDKNLTFAELNSRANQLSGHLRSLGVGRESLVGICIDRSLEMAVGITGILKSGGAYLPLDPEYPANRLAFMIEDAKPSLIVTTSTLAHLVPASCQTVLLDTEWAAISEQSPENLSDSPLPSNLAYVIYTSGSTGEPKGVMIEHGNLSNYLLALNREIGIRSDDVYLHMASIAFSSSRRQLLLPLSQGAQVLIASSEERKDPIALFETIKRGAVTVMDAVPSFWRNCTTILSAMDQSARRALIDNKVRLMLSASEPLPSDIPRTWTIDFGHPARHVHMFGQTETAGIVCINSISLKADASLDRIPIGSPIANTEILVLDSEMKPCPPGVSGELYIGGAGVGRGYLNRPDLTAEKFVTLNGRRLYRTGDWARLSADGRLEFTGRRDQQIKLRGFRVELGEVEAALLKHPAIRDAAVVARQDDEHTRLAAYFVTGENPANASDLRQFLGSLLPDYAVPSIVVRLDALPLSANGKVDRLALSREELPPLELSSRYLAPSTEIEIELARVWSSLLNIDTPGVNDNFFELGGNSLLAGQVIVRVRHHFNIEAPITWLFESPTIKALATRVEIALAKHETRGARALVPVSRDQQLPLSFSQQRLWFLDQLDPESHAYNLAHAIEITGQLDTGALRKALNGIIARHEVLRTRFVSVGGTPLQQIDLPAEVDWQSIDLRKFAPEERAREAERLIRDESSAPLNLAQGPMLRAMLLRVDVESYVLLLTIHHIASDGWSANILAGELSELYRAFRAGEEPALPELPVQYADFAFWQRERFAEGALEAQLNYWRQQLDGAPPVLNLPTDYPRGGAQSYRGAKLTKRLPAELIAGLKRFSRAHDATLFMVLLAAFDLLLSLYSGQSDIVVGSPIAGRDQIEAEPLIGFFINTLALRNVVSPRQTVAELIGNVRETALSAYANQQVPFENLVIELTHDRSTEHNPIFQVMFVLQDGKSFRPNLHGLQVRKIESPADTAKFDLSLEAVDGKDGLDISISYSTDLYDAASAEQMLFDYQLLLEQFVANPQQLLGEMPALTWKPKCFAEAITPATNAAHQYVAPSSPIEEELVSIWQEVLAVDHIGVEDNFFALGGHSLMATQVIARIRTAFDYELPLRTLFDTPRISALACAIRENHAVRTEDDEMAALLAELEGISDDEAQNQVTRAARP